MCSFLKRQSESVGVIPAWWKHTQANAGVIRVKNDLTVLIIYQKQSVMYFIEQSVTWKK